MNLEEPHPATLHINGFTDGVNEDSGKHHNYLQMLNDVCLRLAVIVRKVFDHRRLWFSNKNHVFNNQTGFKVVLGTK